LDAEVSIEPHPLPSHRRLLLLLGTPIFTLPMHLSRGKG
jgi:hypothetical protein